MLDVTDDLTWSQQADDPTRPERPTKCRRHDWLVLITDPFGAQVCRRCGRVKDEAASRRGRTNKNRGNAIQRKRIEGLGGRNLSGNNENLDGIGLRFRYEVKSGQSYPERLDRWLKGIPLVAGQIGVLIVTDTPGAGHRARSLVVVDYDSWRDLHGELEKADEKA